MTDLRKLSKAVQTAEFPSHEWAQAVREMLNEVAERMEPTVPMGRCERCLAMAPLRPDGLNVGHWEPDLLHGGGWWRCPSDDQKADEKFDGGAA